MGDNNLISLTMHKKWQPPPSDYIKINWDATVNAKEGYIGLGVVARDCKGDFLGAQCEFKPITVDAKTAKAMAALWAVLFCKAAGFSEVIFEGDSVQVVTEISSSPPYLSKTSQFMESIIKELQYL